MSRQPSRCKYFGKPTGEQFPDDVSVGLGDRVERFLSSVGITKERFAAVVAEEDCGCNKRQDWLNKAGEKLGLAPGQMTEFREAVKESRFTKQPLYTCEKIGSCIRLGEYPQGVLETLENHNIGACLQCPHFAEKES